MTVWVVHPVKDDISAAAQFGDIRYITDGYVYPDELMEGPNNTRCLPRTTAAMYSRSVTMFNPATDYLLIAGDHLQLIQFTATLAAVSPFDGFNVLRYDREAKGYLPVFIQP